MDEAILKVAMDNLTTIARLQGSDRNVSCSLVKPVSLHVISPDHRNLLILTAITSIHPPARMLYLTISQTAQVVFLQL